MNMASGGDSHSSTSEVDQVQANSESDQMDSEDSKEREEPPAIIYTSSARLPPRTIPADQEGLDQWRRDIWESVLPPEYEHLDSVYLVWKRERLSHLCLKPCVRQLLDDLGTHFTIGIVTNGPSVAQWEKVKETGVQKYCDSVVISGDHNVEKPDRAIFDIALAELQVKPCECVMVGDKIEADILGGKNVGVKMTVWLNGRGKVAPNDIVPDFTIDNIKDLQTVLYKS
ncbi:hypothetical protein O3P69_010972 [Scylla paramamosain]|uniref:N-acylneuraminate-9-phosphatase n=1 Tax=Scylla paramamosain TaxID=85552 RepID=A0AAW0SJT4_SCYPA